MGRWWIAALAVVAAACGGDAGSPDDGASPETPPDSSPAGSAVPPLDPAPAATVPFTGPATELAPSQQSQATVAPPTVPARCDREVLTIEAEVAPGDSTVIVTFRNDAAVRCEVNLGTSWATTHDVEPSVWLTPGSVAELWGAGAPCAAGSPPQWPLEINGVTDTVELPAGAPCDPVPTAFFPP